MSVELDKIVEQVRRSRKYRHLCPETVQRVARSCAERSTSHKEAVKRTKRKLHQVCAMYLGKWNERRANEILDTLPPDPDPKTLQSACKRIMGGHASTRERLPVLGELYRGVFEITGVPQRVLDLGCGLHPFALPWMDLPREIHYTAWDIDQRLVSLVNRFFQIVGVENGKCFCKDLLVEDPTDPADVAFLFKLVPGMEQQEGGSARRLLRNVPGRFVVVSFPVRSVTGRSKNMPANYAAVMEGILSGLSLQAVRIDCEQELLYVIDKRNSGLGPPRG